MALCMLALILLAFVVLLLVFQKVGANPPLILFWLYPVVVGLYGVFLGVRMMFALACCEERLHAAIVLGSLLVSFVVGAIIPSVLQNVRASLCWCELSDASCRGGLCSDFA